MKSLSFIILMCISASLFSQTESKNILLIHAAQRDSQNGVFPSTGNETWYDQLSQMSVSDPTVEYIAEYLQGLLSLTNDYTDVEVDYNSVGNANSIADIYYDPQFKDIKSIITNGDYKYVILFDSEQAYAYPEVVYEGCKQFAKPILETGGTPMLMMYYSSYVAEVDQLGASLYRAANGNGIELIPAGYAIDEANLQGRRVGVDRAEQAMISASAIYKKITGFNAENANYIPTYEYTDINSSSQYSLSKATITELATYATNAVDTHKNIEHYNASYQNDGAVVYRDINVTNAPFNNNVTYFYKGSSTQTITSERLDTLINHSFTTSAKKLGNQNFSTRDWTVDDTELRQNTFKNQANLGLFLYVGGSDPGANAQDVINSNQPNVVPLVFDWIKGFESVGGVTSTTNALNEEGCAALWYNYHFRGWKTIPLTIGMGRLNEYLPRFIASDDALHISDPLLYMNAAMIIASSMGTKLSIPNNLNTRKGSWTQTELETAIEMGHDLVKELAYMSETFSAIQDSNLSIETKKLPKVVVNQEFNYQLIANGGTGSYTWELISSSALPNGISLASNGLISGTTSTDFEIQNIALKVTDDTGAFRKVGLNIVSTLDGGLSNESLDQLSDKTITLFPNPVTNGELNVLFLDDTSKEVTLKLYTNMGRLLLQKDYGFGQEVILNVNNISSGIYILIITTGTTTSAQKVVVKK